MTMVIAVTWIQISSTCHTRHGNVPVYRNSAKAVHEDHSDDDDDDDCYYHCC